MEMAKYILSIFKYYLPIVWSWGFNNPIAIKDGLRFNVQGYLHKGKVEVVYEGGSDLFIVRTLNPNGSVKKEEAYVYLDNLVNVIDGMVERCDNYEERVKSDYNVA